MVAELPTAAFGGFLLAERQQDKGLGLVYSAWKQGLPNWIARVFRPQPDGSIASIGRLRDPASPYILTYVHSYTSADNVVLVRPRMERTLQMSRAVDPQHYRSMAVSMLTGLSDLHANGLTHGDLRPSNLERLGDSRLRLADYGYRQLLGDNVTVAALRRDRRYLAPELGDQQTSEPTDVYAFATTYLELLLGRPYREASAALSELRGQGDLAVDSSWLEYLEASLSAWPSHRPTIATLLQLFQGEALSEADVAGVLASSALRQRLRRYVHSFGVPASDVDDLVQDVLMRVLARFGRDAVDVDCGNVPDVVERYVFTSARHAVYNATRARLRSGATVVDSARLADLGAVGVEAVDPITAWQRSQEIVDEVSAELGPDATAMLRARMYGASLTAIAELLSSSSRTWTVHQVFMALFRLRRGYPELNDLLPGDDVETARREIGVWLEGLGFGATADRSLLVAELVGSGFAETADELHLSVKAARQRLRRLAETDPWVHALLVAPSSHAAWFDDAAHELSTVSGMSRVSQLDPTWRAIVQRRAAAVLEVAREEGILSTREAADLILADLQNAQDTRATILDQPMVPWSGLDADAVADDSAAFTGSRTGALVVLPDRSGRFVVPAFHFDENGRIRHTVAKVNHVLDPDKDPWGAAAWWVHPNGRLHGASRPVDLLDTDREVELIQLAVAMDDPD